jgi:hypothetical protein
LGDGSELLHHPGKTGELDGSVEEVCEVGHEHYGFPQHSDFLPDPVVTAAAFFVPKSLVLTRKYFLLQAIL